MRNNDLFSESYSALTGNKVRSSLTMLGIVIGIGSVIAMVAVGQGAQDQVQNSIQSIGSNLILITPGVQRGVGTAVSAGRGSAQSLTLNDEKTLASQLQNIKAIEPEVTRRSQVTAKGTNTNTQILGTTGDYTTVRNVSVSDGSFINDQQVSSLAKVAVLGPAAESDLFGTSTEAVGQSIRIGQTQFKVIGVTAAKGGSGFFNQDDMIFVPITTAQHYLTGNESVSTIAISAQNTSDMAAVQAQATTLMLNLHNISDPASADFTIQNQADIVAAASSVTGTFTILLASIAGISLLVGGIGIMNMMLTTVTERTREIGLRKAIGATPGDINRQFLTEAIMLTFTGGAAGVLLGWLLALVISHFAGIAAQVSLTAVILAFGVSAAVGLLFGYYPARRAAKLNPIDALRFE